MQARAPRHEQGLASDFDGASVDELWAAINVREEGDDSYFFVLHVHVQFTEVPGLGLNWTGPVEPGYCEYSGLGLQELFTLDDGRFLALVENGCGGGEDYFDNTDELVVLLIDARARAVEVIWTGANSMSAAMGVCSSRTMHAFTQDGDELVITKLHMSRYDKKAERALGFEVDCAPASNSEEVVGRVPLQR